MWRRVDFSAVRRFTTENNACKFCKNRSIAKTCAGAVGICRPAPDWVYAFCARVAQGALSFGIFIANLIPMFNPTVSRSFVIPVLNFSPHSPYNIHTLLNDLAGVQGEVICIFNSQEVFEALRAHPRIDKFAYNNLNPGVSRSWNQGLQLAEGEVVYVLNADLHIGPKAIEELEHYVLTLPRAVIVGPQGSWLDYPTLKVLRYFQKGEFIEPVCTHDVSGFCFAIHHERFVASKLSFDNRFSPFFMEEWDIGLQAVQANLACWTVPVVDFDHVWGVSGLPADTQIEYFGRSVFRSAVHAENQRKFVDKWFGKPVRTDPVQDSTLR